MHEWVGIPTKKVSIVTPQFLLTGAEVLCPYVAGLFVAVRYVLGG